uniref:PKD domain-containing protein n=1 Tax=Actinoplanes sp. RD1 TaxID=3064538 RepID=UPI002742113F
TIASGAYYVQTNLGGADRAGDPAIGAYRVNAAAAEFSRQVASDLYGEHRPYGYLIGGSGGSYQVLGAAENTVGVWDGFVPFVMGVPYSIPSAFTVRLHTLRVLRQRDKFPGVLDAVDPGGSGDLYAGLDDEERAALDEATLLGYPPRGWWNHTTLDSGYFTMNHPGVAAMDPTYVTDFWTEPGYLGTDPASAIGAARFSFETTVAAVIPGPAARLELAEPPERDLRDAHVVALTGPAAGQSVPISAVDGRVVSFPISADRTTIAGFRPGDLVRIDNSWILALQTYQRHQVPTPDLYGWNQFRDAAGRPAHPQRPRLLGPVMAAGVAGSVPDGRIHGKMLVVQNLMDIDAFPWFADWYRSRVADHLGDAAEDSFALWYIDHAQHDNPSSVAAEARTIAYGTVLQQALRDLSAWVERGIRPATTSYTVAGSQVVVPAGAAERGGVQPVVDLRADGGVRAEVAVGQPVTFHARVEVPPGAGSVVAAEWDFLGSGDYPVPAAVATPQPVVDLSATHAFTAPGTYFPVLRAASHRDGDQQTPFGRIQNLGRVRVVVR